MIEIRTNLKGEIICKETEESKGIGTYWIFDDLQNYVAEKKVPKNVLHHLCLMAVRQMERICELHLKEAEVTRLAADTEVLILHIYYEEETRDFSVEIKDNEFEFMQDKQLIQKITLKRFESDMRNEPDIKQNAIQLINFALDNLKLNNREREMIADKMVEEYQKNREKKFEK